MSDSGFIEIIVTRRRPGRRSRRKLMRVTLVDGTRLEFGDQVPPALVWAVVEAVLPPARKLPGELC